MKKLIMMITGLVVISYPLIGQQIDRNSVTYRGGFSFREHFESFYQRIMKKHNGTDFTLKSRKEQSRRLRKEHTRSYVLGERRR